MNALERLKELIAIYSEVGLSITESEEILREVPKLLAVVEAAKKIEECDDKDDRMELPACGYCAQCKLHESIAALES